MFGLLLLALLSPLQAQEVAPPPAPPPAPAVEVPRLEKQPVGTCGCSVYAPKGFTVEPPEKSLDGADVWTGSARIDKHEFGIIAVKFQTPFDGASPTDLEDLLVGYMEFLKTQLKITNAVGVGKGHTLPSNPNARGIIDFWKDDVGDDWAVKAWVDKTHLAVLFVAGPGDFPIPSVQQMFLDGFRFE